ncbi:membrane dipeptidase [Geosmithia morbida]|uniref:Dipeptidase n=1 Tax=Geosmithia morbida TaxID=1094350 RepID=A0A9P4YYG5_9HYPO|nr:membrane dipeptidase [Geosmithia morbida]KAF4125406.1 membrane dipeptidase [Geosmithia morbida]
MLARASGIIVLALAILAVYRYGTINVVDVADYKARADRILRRTPLIDGHNDIAYLFRVELQNKINDDNIFTFRQGLASHTDLQRMRKGRVGGQFWSVFVECPALGHLDDPSHSVRDTLEQVDVAKRFISRIDDLHYCETSSCVPEAFKRGRIASMLGAEGLHQTGSSIAVIRQLFDLGVRYITVTHNCDNPYATAASTVTSGGADGGLTEFGAAGIREMNRLGMMIDLSHTSHRAMRQILNMTTSPVIFSHSACYELARSYRNAPDDVLARLPSNGGLLMVMFVKRFLNAENPDAANIETVVDHIMHIVQIAGWDHVGIGGDFDGTVTLAEGIDSVADYPKLVEAVMRRGATDEDVEKLLGGNLLR